MKNLSSREKTLIIILAVLLVLYGYGRVFLAPTFNEIKISLDNVNKYKEEIESSKNSVALKEAQKKKLESLKVEVDNSIKTLPQSERNPEIAHRVKTLCDANGISITSLSFGGGINTNAAVTAQTPQNPANTGQNTANVTPVPVVLQIGGSSKGLVNFILALEKDTRITDISTVAITGGTSTNQATINANFYYSGTGNDNDELYDFNKGSYGKEDLFR